MANPFIADATYLFSRMLAAWFAVGVVTLVFTLRRCRIITLIGTHFLLDLATGFMIGILPLLSR